MKGLWKVKGTEPVLYTDKCADIIVDKRTGKEYLRGERVLFKDKKVPAKIEDSGNYEFVYLKNKTTLQGKPTTEDYAREIYVNSLLKKKD